MPLRRALHTKRPRRKRTARAMSEAIRLSGGAPASPTPPKPQSKGAQHSLSTHAPTSTTSDLSPIAGERLRTNLTSGVGPREALKRRIRGVVPPQSDSICRLRHRTDKTNAKNLPCSFRTQSCMHGFRVIHGYRVCRGELAVVMELGGSIPIEDPISPSIYPRHFIYYSSMFHSSIQL